MSEGLHWIVVARWLQEVYRYEIANTSCSQFSKITSLEECQQNMSRTVFLYSTSKFGHSQCRKWVYNGDQNLHVWVIEYFGDRHFLEFWSTNFLDEIEFWRTSIWVLIDLYYQKSNSLNWLWWLKDFGHEHKNVLVNCFDRDLTVLP